MTKQKFVNPHFDDNRVVWKDEYSGIYQPVNYSEQFDHEWRLFLENKTGFKQHTGVETEDIWINDRIFDLTGVDDYLKLKIKDTDRNVGGRQNLDLRFAPNFFEGKLCLDAACGAGRWTKTLLALGAKVKSIDVSEHGLKSVRRFNQDVERLDIFDIATRSDLHEAFDFTLNWGVVMHTHDPKLAFENVARTVRPGGGLYIVVYAPTQHNSPDILNYRKHYHSLQTFDEKLAYAYHIADKPENTINYLDMLHTFYNWVVPEKTIHDWFHANGFMDVITLNASEGRSVAYHVFGRKRSYDQPLRNDNGDVLTRVFSFDSDQAIPLTAPYIKEIGYAWYVPLNAYVTEADTLKAPYRSRLLLLEDGKPLWERHILHDDIRSIGAGRYSHWGNGLIFSTSDNSDPNTNGKSYEIVRVKSGD